MEAVVRSSSVGNHTPFCRQNVLYPSASGYVLVYLLVNTAMTHLFFGKALKKA